jgi:hypothetical protein
MRKLLGALGGGGGKAAAADKAKKKVGLVHAE